MKNLFANFSFGSGWLFTCGKKRELQQLPLLRLFHWMSKQFNEMLSSE